MDEQTVNISAVVEGAEKVKEKLKTDRDAVRKIMAGAVAIDEYVTVHPDKALNREFQKLDEKLQDMGLRVAKLDDESDAEYLERNEGFQAEYEGYQEQFAALKEQVSESGVTFHLVSPGRKAIKNVRNKARDKFPLPEESDANYAFIAEDREEWYKAARIAAHLVQDDYTVEDIEEIRDNWPVRCFVQLLTAADTLTLQDDYLKNSFNPDF